LSDILAGTQQSQIEETKTLIANEAIVNPSKTNKAS
jgi:hypothetical protein